MNAHRSKLPRFLLFAVSLATTPGIVAQPSSRPPPPAPTPIPEVVTPSSRARLEALVPTNPDAYYELGEEIADAAADPRSVQLARELYALAFHLDQARGGQRLAAQACLALSAMESSDRERQWLVALARSLDRRSTRPEWVRRAEVQIATQTGYRAAVTLGQVRAGEGVAAKQGLADAGVVALLKSFERLLSATGDTGGMRWIEREASRWPCPECHNQRTVKKGTGKDAITRLCTTCAGNPGPKLNNTALIAHLRFESRLLNGIQRSWAAQTAADQGAPLRDPDADDVCKVFNVDPIKTLWRDGRWIAPPGAESAPAKPKPTIDPTPEPPKPKPESRPDSPATVSQ